MLLDLLAKNATQIRELDFNAGSRLPDGLLLRSDGAYSMFYAPMDYVNTEARIVFVGLTPGLTQALNALRSMQRSLLDGISLEVAARLAKSHASFSGPMRNNLVSLLDHFRVNEYLNVISSAELFDSNSNLAHFTSVLRYPIFKNGANFNGRFMSTRFLREVFEDYFVPEASMLDQALFVPIGNPAAEGLASLVERGLLKSDQVISGIVHPSGANAERIAYQLGRKSAADLSTKTNAQTIDAASRSVRARLARWAGASNA